jgi:hypothetical protein
VTASLCNRLFETGDEESDGVVGFRAEALHHGRLLRCEPCRSIPRVGACQAWPGHAGRVRH